MLPKIDGAVGLGWRQRREGPVAYWLASAKLVERGYPTKTVRLWPPTGAPHPGVPNARDQALIASECQRLQGEMLLWKVSANGGSDPQLAAAAFDGTVTGLSRAYQLDPDSGFQRLRFFSRRHYLTHLRAIELTVGKRSLANLTGRDFLRWYGEWAADADGRKHLPRAHARITMLRTLLSFGAALLEEPECQRLGAILAKLEFKKGRARTAALSAAQAIAIRRHAHAIGRPEVALAQALQFELLLRQKDVIGEWIPLSEPGLSAVTYRGLKWVCGLDWREVSADLVLTHALSKSLRGRDGVAEADGGKVKSWRLPLYPMVMEELSLIPPEQRSGPMIKHARSGRPFFGQNEYRNLWRQIADAVGVPRNVQNRDSRAGGITETLDVTDGNLEAARQAAGHSDSATTRIYNREEDARTAQVARLRAEKRSGNKDSNV